MEAREPQPEPQRSAGPAAVQALQCSNPNQDRNTDKAEGPSRARLHAPGGIGPGRPPNRRELRQVSQR